MKSLLLTFFLFTKVSLFSQLKLLIGQETKIINGIEVFQEYKISIYRKNHVYNIRSEDGKVEIFTPKSSTYYEVFNKKYLLATEFDSSYIKGGSSIAPFFSSRNKVYILPLKTILKKEKYFVNFENKVINEEFAEDSFHGEYFMIKKISIKKRSVVIFNPKTKAYKKLKLQLE
jgi:hypothetical protein